MIVVIDTNVLVSGIINPHGPPGRLVDLLRSGALRLAVDDRILAEYVDVLHRPQLSRYFLSSDLAQIIDYLRCGSMHVLVRQHIRRLPDQSDAPFLEVAMAAKVPLITGNIRHYPDEWSQKCAIFKPACFLDSLDDIENRGTGLKNLFLTWKKSETTRCCSRKPPNAFISLNKTHLIQG